MGTLQDLGASLSITTPSAPSARQVPLPVRQADQPAPAAQPVPAPQMQANANPPAPPADAAAPPPQSLQPPGVDTAREREALAQQLNQMRDQLAAATQQVTALRTQADQEHQDLQRLQQQRAAAQQTAEQTNQGNADEAAARARRADELAKQVADQQA